MEELSRKQHKVLQYVINCHILNKGIGTVKVISEHFGYNYLTTFRLIEKLVEKGYIEKAGAKHHTHLVPAQKLLEAFTEIPIKACYDYYEMYKRHNRIRGNPYQYMTEGIIKQKVLLSIGALVSMGLGMDDVSEFAHDGLKENMTKLIANKL